MLLESYLHRHDWVKTILSNWIFLHTKCYSFSVNFSVLSHLQKKQITYEKNCITLLIYSICLWKNDSLNVMDSKFIGVTWQNMGVQWIYLIYEIGCNPTQKKTLCTHAANILVLKVCHYKGNSMRTSSGIIFCVYV